MKTPTIIFDPIAPCPDPVSIPDLLTEIEAVIKKHVILSDHAAAALAVWVLHTYTFEQRDTVAYIAIESPEKRCGKTTLLSVLAAMAHNPLIASNVTVGALFRAIDTCRPALFIDEADTFLAGNGVMRGIINSGNTWRTAYVLRLTKSKQNLVGQTSIRRFQSSDDNSLSHACASGGEGRDEGGLITQPASSQLSTINAQSSAVSSTFNQQPLTFNHESGLKKYSCWCPKVIAMIGQVPDTIADRSIVVKMSRKLVSETCAPLAELYTVTIKSKCARFAADNSQSIAGTAKIRGEGLNDRAADTFDPLYVIARLAGPEWEAKLHAAALALTFSAQAVSFGNELLLDIFSIFLISDKEKLFSRNLAHTLRDGVSGMKSFALKYSAINEYRISQILRPYGIKPVAIRIGSEVNKGYRVEDFHEAIKRYIPVADFRVRADELGHQAQLQNEAAVEAAREEALIKRVLAEVPKDRVLSAPEVVALLKKYKGEEQNKSDKEPGDEPNPGCPSSNVADCCHPVAENVAT